MCQGCVTVSRVASMRLLYNRRRKLAQKHGTVTRTAFEQLQQRLGFNFVPSGALNDADLDVRFVSCFTWDWAHCLCIHGALNHEIGALMKALDKHQLGYAALDSYLGAWAWPAGYAHPRAIIGQLKGQKEDAERTDPSTFA